MTEPITDGEQLIVGQLYRVEWDDCCAAGKFTAKLAEKVYIDDAGSPYLSELVFANGVTLDHKSYGTEFTPIDEGEGGAA